MKLCEPALKMYLLHCLSCSCAQLICPVYQTPPVTTRQCVGLCTQKPGSFTRSWRRLRVPKRWVLTFITIMAVGLYCYFFRHINCRLEGLAVWPYIPPYTPWLTWLLLSVGTTDSVGRVTLVGWDCCCMVTVIHMRRHMIGLHIRHTPHPFWNTHIIYVQ